MARLRISLIFLLTALMVAALATSANAQVAGPSMTVTPQSGVRPLSVIVKGTPCVSIKPVAPDAAHQIRISWQLDGAPWTSQTRILPDGQNGWMTTLILGVPNIGVNLIEASCFTSDGQEVLAYPDQKVEVLPLPPTLTASPTSITVGESTAVTANQCPDPDLPRLGGDYFVRFTLEYLIPPSGTEGPWSESTTVWTNQSGVASTTFTLPPNAPTEGGSYRVRASCLFEELGGGSVIFNYSSVAIQVSAQPEPTPTPTVEPTATPTATPAPTATPLPTAIPVPSATPLPTPQPTATPWPTPTPRPGGGGVIIFTG